MTIRVSVVVPTCNRPHLLCHCLASLVTQEFDPAAFEILVVDDAASVRTRRVVERWHERAQLPPSRPQARIWEFASNGALHKKAHIAVMDDTKHRRQSTRYLRATSGSWQTQATTAAPRLRYIPITGRNHGPAVARNHGWRVARGQIIAFTDDDCLPQPGWLRAGVATLTGSVLGAAGRTVVPIARVPTDYELNAAQMQNARFLTANCFYWRRVLAEVGGFDERFTTAWREDSDLYFTLVERFGNNGCFMYTPEAVVVHPPRPAPWGISLSEQRKSMFNALLYKKHPDLYRTMIQPGPPWHYYYTAAAFVVTLAAAAAGQAALASGAAAVWLLLVARFGRQRLRHTSRAPAHVFEMVITSAAIPLLAIFWRLAGAIRFRVWFY